MHSDPTFAARLLETSADLIAGRAARQLLAGDSSSPAHSLGPWRSQLRQRIEELIAALLLEEPLLFRQQSAWTESAWRARGVPVEELKRSRKALEEVLRDELPGPAFETVQAYLLAGSSSEPDSAPSDEAPSDGVALDPARPLGTVALTYLETVLEGDRRAAIAGLVAVLDAGTPLSDIYEDVLVPVQREIGEMWQRDEILVSEEHFASSTTQQAMAVLSQKAVPRPPNGHTVVAAAVGDNPHSIGVRIVTDLFEQAGWRAISVGAQVPIADLLAALSAFDADLLLVSASLGVHLASVKATLEVIRREYPQEQLKVLVGGRAFDAFPDLWDRVGADGYGKRATDAIRLAEQLLPVGQ